LAMGWRSLITCCRGRRRKDPAPIDVLEESKQANIRVHVIGVDLDQEIREKPAVMLLMDTVERNGGKTYNAESERDLVAASKSIDSIEKSLLVSRVYVQDVPVYQWFAVPGLVCLIVAMGLRAIPYFVDQT
jgi:hypothetical protein